MAKKESVVSEEIKVSEEELLGSLEAFRAVMETLAKKCGKELCEVFFRTPPTGSGYVNRKNILGRRGDQISEFDLTWAKNAAGNGQSYTVQVYSAGEHIVQKEGVPGDHAWYNTSLRDGLNKALLGTFTITVTGEQNAAAQRTNPVPSTTKRNKGNI